MLSKSFVIFMYFFAVQTSFANMGSNITKTSTCQFSTQTQMQSSNNLNFFSQIVEEIKDCEDDSFDTEDFDLHRHIPSTYSMKQDNLQIHARKSSTYQRIVFNRLFRPPIFS